MVLKRTILLLLLPILYGLPVKKQDSPGSYATEIIENLLSDNITEVIGSSQEVEVIEGDYSGNETKPRSSRRSYGGHSHSHYSGGHHHFGGYGGWHHHHIGGYGGGFHHHHHYYSYYSPSYYYSYYTPSYYGSYGYGYNGYSNNYYGYGNSNYYCYYYGYNCNTYSSYYYGK
ncbi:unnamed protein product [Caenorhabditis brenneri]